MQKSYSTIALHAASIAATGLEMVWNERTRSWVDCLERGKGSFWLVALSTCFFLLLLLLLFAHWLIRFSSPFVLLSMCFFFSIDRENLAS